MLITWMVKLEQAILAGQCPRPMLGDEVFFTGEAVMVVHFHKQQRCGCSPASLLIGRRAAVPILRLCPAHQAPAFAT